MNQQHLEDENQEPLRSQRMTEDEARAVIGLWQQEKTDSGGLTTSPAVPDVAEGLDIGIADVQRLLAQVRARREEEEQLLTLEQWQAKLDYVRLAEETRKLAEVRRQRAKLQRRQSQRQRLQTAQQFLTDNAGLSIRRRRYQYTSCPHHEEDFTPVAIIIICLLCAMIGVSVSTPPERAASNAPGQSYACANNPVVCTEFSSPAP
jgi:hypothetical protein